MERSLELSKSPQHDGSPVRKHSLSSIKPNMLSLGSPPSRRPGYHRLASEAEEPSVTAQQQHLANPPLIQGTDSASPADGESDVEQREILEVSSSDIVTLQTLESNNLSASPPQESEFLDCKASPSRVELPQHLHDEENFVCKSRRPVRQRRRRCLPISILVLSIYSTIFSGLWLLIAIKRPQYGNIITPAGIISGNMASLLFTALAKSIEVSFVAVFGTFLGQCVSARAMKKNKGFAIADISMTGWITQAGTWITHWKSARYAVRTLLGAAALQATVTALLYTTASNALVSPKPHFLKERKDIYSTVLTSFANLSSVTDQCISPIGPQQDPYGANTACFQLQEQSESYHNLAAYLSAWVETSSERNGSADASLRPNPLAVSPSAQSNSGLAHNRIIEIVRQHDNTRRVVR